MCCNVCRTQSKWRVKRETVSGESEKDVTHLPLDTSTETIVLWLLDIFLQETMSLNKTLGH